MTRISQSEIRLYPRDESKFVSLNGGGDIVDLKIEDPDKVINAKWNAKTNILEIQANYEGEAMIRVISQDKKEKTLKVVVRCDGTAGRVGIYGTTSHSLYEQMNTGLTTAGVIFKTFREEYGRAPLQSHTPTPGRRAAITVFICS